MKRSLPLLPLLASLAAACLLPFPLSAATPTPKDELLRLVPDDAGFCLIVQDLRGHFDALAGSPFVEQFQKSALAKTVQGSEETQKLIDVEKKLQKAFGLDWEKLRTEVFGDAFAFAYRPGPPGQPKQEQDLILLRARDGKLLHDLIDRLNQVQKESGDLTELETREYAGQKYFRRVERKEESFCFLHGPVLALSSKEEVLKQAIDRDRKAGDGEPAVSRQLRLLGADKHLAALWINPRAFEPEMEQRATAATGSEAAVLQSFLRHWKALDGIAVSLKLEKDLELVLSVRARMDALPAATRKVLTEAAKPSDLWDHFPDDALLATAGRVDATAFLDALGEFLTKEDRQTLHDALGRGLGAALGKDVVKEILPCLGPDVGLCIAARPAKDKDWFPHVLVAVRTSPGETKPFIDQALFSAVNTYAQLTVLEHNRTHQDQLSLKTLVQDKVEVKYLDAEKPSVPGLRPAFALTQGYLVLASSPDAVAAFNNPTRGDRPRDEFPLFRTSLKGLRQFVKDRREPLAAAVAEQNGIKKEDAEARLDALVVGLELFDRLELTERPTAGQVTLTLRLQPAQPFRK
jgi:Protein of unknown function (DUF3352)